MLDQTQLDAIHSFNTHLYSCPTDQKAVPPTKVEKGGIKCTRFVVVTLLIGLKKKREIFIAAFCVFLLVCLLIHSQSKHDHNILYIHITSGPLAHVKTLFFGGYFSSSATPTGCNVQSRYLWTWGAKPSVCVTIIIIILFLLFQQLKSVCVCRVWRFVPTRMWVTCWEWLV